MYSSSSLFLILATAIALCSVDAWTATSSASSFGGRSLTSTTKQVVVLGNGSNMDMKKGKANVPPQMRGQYARQQEMAAMQQQMRASSVPGDDGLPVFNLFVRTTSQKIWYPCGSFKGDDRSAALAKSWSEGGMLSGISKKQLDGGIAGSLYSDLAKLKDTVMRAYPQLRKKSNEMEFGYKLAFDGLPEDKAKQTFPVEPKEPKGALDGLRNIFS